MKPAPRPGIDLVNEDGTPMDWNVRRFDANVELIESGTRPQAIEKLKPKINEIRTLFREGNISGLLRIAAETAPVAQELSGISLGDAQVLNDFSGLALSCLVGEDPVRPLRYNYQSSFGQNSGHVEMNRYFAAMGLLGKENQEEALAEIRRKNPDADGLNRILESQQRAIHHILDIEDARKSSAA